MEQDSGKAAGEFQTSVRLKPVQTEAYYQLGQMAMDDGRGDEAARLFGVVVARMPQHGGAVAGLGILRYRARDYTAARTYLTQAVSFSPAYQPAHYFLGLTEARLGDKAASAAELATALRLTEAQQGRGKPVPAAER